MNSRPQLEAKEMLRDPFDYLVDIKLGIQNSNTPGHIDLFGEKTLVPPGFEISEIEENIDFSATCKLKYKIEAPFKQIMEAELSVNPDGSVELKATDRELVKIDNMTSTPGNIMRAIIRFIEYYEIFIR